MLEQTKPPENAAASSSAQPDVRPPEKDELPLVEQGHQAAGAEPMDVDEALAWQREEIPKYGCTIPRSLVI
eukprot:7741946-Prorocentrum_lima.AAC.1